MNCLLDSWVTLISLLRCGFPFDISFISFCFPSNFFCDHCLAGSSMRMPTDIAEGVSQPCVKHSYIHAQPTPKKNRSRMSVHLYLASRFRVPIFCGKPFTVLYPFPSIWVLPACAFLFASHVIFCCSLLFVLYAFALLSRDLSTSSCSFLLLSLLSFPISTQKPCLAQHKGTRLLPENNPSIGRAMVSGGTQHNT